MSAPEALRVLIATIGVGAPYGTDVYTHDLARGLLRRGLLPIVYTTTVNKAADQLRKSMIPVVTDLSAIGGVPDLIHGHHHLETLAALARFPGVPAIFVCHDAYVWHSVPPRSSRIRAIVAVDRNCRDRMIFEHGVAEERIRLLVNPIDLTRFHRRAPLPLRPQRALIFCNSAAEHTAFTVAVREACAARGIEFEIAGVRSGNIVDPGQVLGRYDIVFAKGRSALEAAATGAAVIVSDSRGLAGMLTTSRFESLRQLNLGVRSLQAPVTGANILRELDLYDPADAATVTDRIRDLNDLELVLDQYLDLYDEVLSEERRGPEPADDLREIGAAISAIIPRMYRQQPSPWLPLRAKIAAVLQRSRPLAWVARPARRIIGKFGL